MRNLKRWPLCLRSEEFENRNRAELQRRADGHCDSRRRCKYVPPDRDSDRSKHLRFDERVNTRPDFIFYDADAVHNKRYKYDACRCDFPDYAESGYDDSFGHIPDSANATGHCYSGATNRYSGATDGFTDTSDRFSNPTNRFSNPTNRFPDASDNHHSEHDAWNNDDSGRGASGQPDSGIHDPAQRHDQSDEPAATAGLAWIGNGSSRNLDPLWWAQRFLPQSSPAGRIHVGRSANSSLILSQERATDGILCL